MQLKDFFNINDFIRVVLVGSALLLLIGAAYGIFLHSMYASQVNGVKNDLTFISDLMKAKSSASYSNGSGDDARQFKDVSDRAAALALEIRSPAVTPNSYTYLNYWIASAAFTKLTLNPLILGLPPETVGAFNSLDGETVLGKAGWWGRGEFYGFDVNTGQYRMFLAAKPELETHYWSFYLFVFLISVVTIFLCVKEPYELPAIPEIVYGLFLPALFSLVYSLAAIISLTGLIRFLDPSQVDLFVLMLSFVITSVISAFGGLVASLVRVRKKRGRE